MMISLLLTTSAFAVNLELSPGDDIVEIINNTTLGAGSEIVFNDGVFVVESPIQFIAEGKASKPVVLKAAPGAKPILRRGYSYGYIGEISDSSHVEVNGLIFEANRRHNQFDAEPNFGGLSISNSKSITVEDCEIIGTPRTGLRVSGDSADINILRTHISKTDETAIYIAGDPAQPTRKGTIANNWIHDVSGDYSYGILLGDGAQGMTVTDNNIHKIAKVDGAGIRIGSTEYGDAHVIESNAIWDIEGRGMRIAGSTQLRNNLIFGTTNDGIRVEDTDNIQDLVMSFNTVANTDGWAVRLDMLQYRDKVVVVNNAFSNTTGEAFYYWDDAITGRFKHYIANNVVTGLVRIENDDAQGVDRRMFEEWVVPGGGVADFVDPDNFDFYPRTGSPLIDSAIATSEGWVPEVDFNGLPRDGEAPDVGAYEWVDDENPGWLIQEGFKEAVEETEEVGGTDVNDSGGCCKKKKDNGEAMLFLPLLGFGVFFRRRRRR